MAAYYIQNSSSRSTRFKFFFRNIIVHAWKMKKKKKKDSSLHKFTNTIPSASKERSLPSRNPLISPWNRAPPKPQLSFLIRTDAPSRFHYIILFNIHPRNPSQNYLRVPSKSPNFRSRVPWSKDPLDILFPPLPSPSRPLLSPSRARFRVSQLRLIVMSAAGSRPLTNLTRHAIDRS